MMPYIKIRYPERLKECHIGRTLELHEIGRLPERIAGNLVVGSAKQVLRCVYGSNLRVVLALLWDLVRDVYFHIRIWLLVLWMDDDDDEFEKEVFKEIRNKGGDEK